MPLQQFPGNHYHYHYHYNFDAIYKSLFEVKFNDAYMRDNCISIKNDIMIFNLNLYEEDLIPFSFINNMISENAVLDYLEISNFKKDGTINYITFLKKFSFVEFVGFLDFDLETSIKGEEIKKLCVKFKYDKMIVVTAKNHKKFIRKIKLYNINKKDS